MRPPPERLSTSSPFNIKVASLRVADFSESQVRGLYAQHTTDIHDRLYYYREAA